MSPPYSIFLVGMMGAGKSTVGVRLARRLDRAFIDADRELEERLGVSVPTIFEVEGEAGFRRRESQLLDELTTRSGLVLATGGGAVLSALNRQMLHSRGRVIYLQASASDLWQRLRRDRNRPLLRTANPRERIQKLTQDREPLYQEVAHHIVTTSRQPIDQIVDAIVALLDQHAAPASAGSSAQTAGQAMPPAPPTPPAMAAAPAPGTAASPSP